MWLVTKNNNSIVSGERKQRPIELNRVRTIYNVLYDGISTLIIKLIQYFRILSYLIMYTVSFSGCTAGHETTISNRLICFQCMSMSILVYTYIAFIFYLFFHVCIPMYI